MLKIYIIRTLTTFSMVYTVVYFIQLITCAEFDLLFLLCGCSIYPGIRALATKKKQQM